MFVLYYFGYIYVGYETMTLKWNTNLYQKVKNNETITVHPINLVSQDHFNTVQSATIAGTRIALYADANCMITLVQYICEWYHTFISPNHEKTENDITF